MDPKYEGLPYRPCVGLMLVNAEGKVFVGKRIEGLDLACALDDVI